MDAPRPFARACRIARRIAVLPLFCVVLLGTPVAAATVTWVGASNGSWFSASNWSPAQVPTASDDAVIDANVTVNVLPGSSSILFNTLSLGDASGNTTPVLNISTAVATAGGVTVYSRATLQQQTTCLLSLGWVTVRRGGTLTHAANPTTPRSAVLNLSVSGDFDLQAGSTIAVDGLGYAGAAANTNSYGSGPGYGGRGQGGGGAGHGGRGGDTYFNLCGGSSYDSWPSSAPADLGSGGGASYIGSGSGGAGGAGGGAVLITVGGALSVNGLIAANGAAGGVGDGVTVNGGGGGGAGGTIRLTASSLLGSGVLRANGGAGGALVGVSPAGGGGGGGRVAITVTASDTSSLTLQANAGTSSGGFNGGSGVIAVLRPGDSLYSLRIGTTSVVAHALTPLSGATPAYNQVEVSNSSITFAATSTETFNSLIIGSGTVIVSSANLVSQSMEVKPGGALLLRAFSTSGNLMVDGGGVFKQMNTVQLGFNSVLVQPGGVLTHAANTTTPPSAVLNLSVSGDFDLQAGATIAVDGLGYAGAGANTNSNGYGPGAGKMGWGGGGGGHGGSGGNGAHETNGGSANDSAAAPANPGSGGGAGYHYDDYGGAGGAGGGAVLIYASGTLTLNGLITANGAAGEAGHGGYYNGGGGGGAGGTVRLNASSLLGSGLVRANGGAGAGPPIPDPAAGGGGGGGRVAVTGCGAGRTQATALGGSAGGSGAGAGGAGTSVPTVPEGCPDAPFPPTGLTVATAGDHSLTATWDPAARALSYTLQLSTAASFTGTIPTTTTSLTSATISGLLSNTTYYLHVSAANGMGDSGFSAAISIRTSADVTPPLPPTLLGVQSRNAGFVDVSWQAAAGGDHTDMFNLYRALTVFPSTAGLTPVQSHVTSTAFSDLPPEDGLYYYAATGLDLDGNESGLSNILSTASIHYPNAPVADLAASFSLTGKEIDLAWGAPSTGTAVAFNVYRATFPALTSVPAYLLRGGLVGLSFVDHPSLTADATYYYRVTSLDAVGNESSGSNAASAPFDVHAPAISVTGVASGGYYNQDRSPAVSVADFSAFTATITLNGAPFESGSAVSAPGSYVLQVQARDVYGSSSSVSVAFTIDKTPPALAILSPSSGSLLAQDTLVAISYSDDFTPYAQLVVRDQNGQAPPYSFTQEGQRTLSLTATDLAGNASTASVTVTLDKTPPAAVTDLRVSAERPGEADLSWTAPLDAVSGVVAYDLRVATFAITTANFASAQALSAPAVQPTGSLVTVTVPDTGSTRFFAVRSTDAAGHFSAPSNPVFLDRDGPALSGLSPAAGSIVHRPATVSVQAADLSGVGRVVFYLDGTAVSTASAQPYSFRWDTLPLPDAEHFLMVRAYDTGGRESVLSAVYTLIYSPPAAPTIASPSDGLITFSAAVTVTGTAEPGTTAQVLLSGVAAGSGLVNLSGGYSVPVTLPVEGDYQLTVVAGDARGQSNPSAPVAVHFNLTPPNPPSEFSAETRSGGRVHLSWLVPGGKLPASYRLYRSASDTALSTGVVPTSSLRVASGISGTAYDDTPPSDGVFYYGATSIDSSNNESGLSDVSAGLSDRTPPSAALALPSGPTVAPGSHPLTLTLTEPLASAPLLLFVAQGAGPQAVSLSPADATTWTGTLDITAATNPGPAVFQFQGADFAGNAGTSITSGRTLTVDDRGPVGAVYISPASPLKAGPAQLALVLDEPAASTPSLAFVTAHGSTVTVALDGTGDAWNGSFTVPAGQDGRAVFTYSAADGLGNPGSTLSSGGSFVIDSTPPGAPLSLGAISGPAGVVHLSWSGPIGEAASAYRVYRDSAPLPSTIAPQSDQTGRLDDIPSDGVHLYQTAALDAAGNEGPLSNPAYGISDSIPPDTPTGASAGINAFGRVEVSWTAREGETYRVYRATYDAPSLAGLSFTSVPLPPLVDTPPQNGTIRYYITAVDAAGNASAGRASAQVFFDRAAPLISVSGVSEGALYNRTVFPAYSASDPALSSVQGQLNGDAFASGSAVSAEGDYTLVVTASNQGGMTSTTTVHFSVDRSTPVVTVTGVSSGQRYSQAVIPIVNVTDPRLASVDLSLDGAAYTAGVPVSADGTHTLTVTARDLAGNVATVSVSFTLDLPPPAPPNLLVAVDEAVGAVLTWSSPAPDTSGYRLWRDSVLMHQGLLSEPRFADPSFAPGQAHVYEVAAVDGSGQEGARTHISVPAVDFTLESYGTLDSGVSYLTRGFFDSVRLRLSNADSSSKVAGPATLELLSDGAVAASAQAPSVSVLASGQATTDGVLPIPVGLSQSASLRATVRLAADIGAAATLRRTFAVTSRDPREPILEAFPEPLVRGTYKSVRVKVNNEGSAQLELLSASPSDLLVELRTPEGLVLSSARLNQSSDGAQGSPSGWFVPVPGGSSVLLDPVLIFVPSALGASAQLHVRLDRSFNGLVSGGTAGPRAFETLMTLSGVSAPPYRVTVRPEQALYDEGSSVKLLGDALDTQNQLVPGATVFVGVSLRGFERTASTRTDADGHYQLTFYPGPSEAGIYTLWAAHPDVTDRLPQSSFSIEGLDLQYGDYTATLTQNSALPFRVSLTNTGQTRVEGLSATVISSAVLTGAGLSLDASSLPSALEAGQSASMAFTASASADAGLGRSVFTVGVQEAHGFKRQMTIYVDAAPSSPAPAIDPTGFNVGMSAGQTRTLEVHLKNTGTRSWQGVTVTAPTLSWASISGSSSLGDVPPNGSKSLFLVLQPPSGLPSQAFAANPLVEIHSSNASVIPVNALITLTASGQGNVAYTVINADKQRDQFGNGVPVPTADATLVSLDVAGISFHSAADSNGLIRFLNVPAGRYSYTVKASGFEDLTGTETVEPGVTISKELLLLTNVVTYDWTVEPTTIQDQYNIQLGITFKTDVPAPVVSIGPAVMNFNMAGGDSADGQITVENKGVVSAANVSLKPQSSDPAVTIDLPYTSIPELKAGQKLVIPVRVSLAHASCHSAGVTALYEYTCAAGVTVKKSAPPISMSMGDCFNLPSTSVGGTGTGDGGGFSGGSTSGGTGGGSGGTSISLSVPASYMSFAITNPPAPQGGGGSQACRAPTMKYPHECVICDILAFFSDPGGDPRIPESDLSISIPKFTGSLDFRRVYDSQNHDSTALGRGWTHSFDSQVRLVQAANVLFEKTGMAFVSYGGAPTTITYDPNLALELNPDLLAELRTPEGRRLLFRRADSGGFTGPPGEPSTLTMTGSTMAPTGFTWTLPDKTIYTYDGSGKLFSIKDRNDNQVTLSYAGGLLSTVQDPDNRTLYTLTYSGGQLTGVTDLAGRAVTFGYDGAGYLNQAQGPKGTMSYGYGSYQVDDLGSAGFGAGRFQAQGTLRLLTSVTSPNGQQTTFTYGAPAKAVDYDLMDLYLTGDRTRTYELGNAGLGMVPIMTAGTRPPFNKSYYTPVVPYKSGYAVDPEGFARWFFPQRFYTLSETGPAGTYTFSHTVDELMEVGSTVITDPRGYKETHYWENKSGRAQTGTVDDPAGGESKTVYDANRYPAQFTDRAGRVTSTVYDSNGNLTRVTDPLNQSTVFTYEPNFNQLASITDPKTNQTRFYYDSKGNLTRAEDAQSHPVTIDYQNGLPRTITDANSKSVTIGRDANGYATSITDPLNRTAHMAYDTLGRVTSITDGASKTTGFQYDTDDNLTQVTDALNGLTRYEYVNGTLDAGKLLNKLYDAKNQQTSFGYDTRGRLTSVTNALGQHRDYVYNDANQLTQVTKPDGTFITFEYDNLGRLTKKNVPGDPVTYDYDAAGNLIKAEDGDSIVQMGYDKLDRVIQVIQTNKPANLTSQITYEYDANGNRTKMTLAANPSPFVWSYTYDSLDRLTSITNPQNKVFNFEYDSLSRRTRLVYPNGIETLYSHDDAGQLTSIVHRRIADQVVIALAAYTYDNAGNRTSMTDWAGTHTFGYDDLHRLTSATHPQGSFIETKNETFGYDGIGNRTSDALTSNFVYDAANRLTSNSRFTCGYDNNGNQTSRTEGSRTTSFAYDANDEMRQASSPDGTQWSYRQDAYSRRIEKSSGSAASQTVRYIYDGPNVLATLDGGNSVTALFTNGLSIAEPLMMRKADGIEHGLYADGLGSIVAAADETGSLEERIEYEAYGKPLFIDARSEPIVSSRSITGHPYAFIGVICDPELGTCRMSRRTYNPLAGTFMQEEPYGLDGPNFYWYAQASPTSFTDPDGKDTRLPPGFAAPGLQNGVTKITGKKLSKKECTIRKKKRIRVYRVWGGKSREAGWYWSPLNPKIVRFWPGLYRFLAGLPSGNLGQKLATGYVDTSEPECQDICTAPPYTSSQKATFADLELPPTGIWPQIKIDPSKVENIQSTPLAPPE